MTLAELKQAISAAGVVGAGGAGFPSAFKYTEDAETLVINAAECEPLLYTDYYIMKRELQKVVGAAELVMDTCKMKEGYLSLKEHTAERLGFCEGQKLSEKLKVKILPNVYPMGDEIVLIYETVGKVIEPGSLPISQGVVVNNVETLYNIYNAVYGGQPVTEKWLTVGGNVDRPCVLKTLVGTPVSELLDKLGVAVPEESVLIDGGPAMGNIINPGSAVITKTTKSLLVLPKSIPAVRSKLESQDISIKRSSSACCSCTRCTDMCPRHLLGYSLEPHKIIRAAAAGELDPQLYTNAQLCCACGVCEIVACCHELSPKKVYAKIKGLMAQNRIRYSHKGAPVKPIDTRNFRMLPSDRFMQLLGVTKFDKSVPEFLNDFDLLPTSVRISMKQHVGAPAKVSVKAGDFVCASDVIGAAAEGISANLHSSIDGKVIKADEKEVVIGS